MRTPTSPFPSRPARRVTMLLGVRDHPRHGSLVVAIMKRARRAHMAGATVYEAHEGYGTSGRIHQNHAMSDDAPVAIVMVDDPDAVDAFLIDIKDLLDQVTVVLDDVDVVEF